MSTDTERRELIRPGATIAYWVSGPERAPVVRAAARRHAGPPRLGRPGRRPGDAVPRRGARPARARGVDAAGRLPVRRRGRRRRGAAGRGRRRRTARARRPEPGWQHRPGDRATATPEPGRRAGRGRLHAATPRRATRWPRRSRSPRCLPWRWAAASGSCSTRRRSPRRTTTCASMSWTPTRTAPPREVVQILASLLDGALHPDPDYRLPVPTLLLVGADDRVGDIAAGSREWAARDPMVEHVVIPGAGHASNQDNPAGVHRRAGGLPGPRPARPRPRRRRVRPARARPRGDWPPLAGRSAARRRLSSRRVPVIRPIVAVQPTARSSPLSSES